ncbi:MAG: type III pantothenate kinase [Candidatus Roizmanbacteria bacterium]|nr:type III pantothenate kinase [Candidatus Roizmanbacteria bacterium]
MLLAIDVGNTHIKFGLFQKKLLVNSWQTVSAHNQTGKRLYEIFQKKDIETNKIDTCVIGSVVPQLTSSCNTFSEKYLRQRAYIIGPATQLPLSVSCDRPQLGADRLADITASYILYGKPMLVIGLGTATVFNVIDKKGTFIGGAIACGLNATLTALTDSAALLPRITLTVPLHTVGTNTVENMQSGIIRGHASLVDGMIDRIQQETGYTMQIIATGGASDMIAGQTNHRLLVNKNLTLEGLRILWEYNQDRTSVQTK